MVPQIPATSNEQPAMMIQLTKLPIHPSDLLAHVGDDSSGGVVLFLGQTRDNSRGEKVIGLEYEAYESLALKQLEKIAAETQQRWPVRAIAIVHRKGYLKVGEISVAIAVACAHRGEAFEACRFAIDTLKGRFQFGKRISSGWKFWVEECRCNKIVNATRKTPTLTHTRSPTRL
jgi:molybdopterin synthase catalytic subunit